jgi:phosphoribosylformylglycinamidine cyclo-ligase
MAKLGSYQQAGVNYEILDHVKQEAIRRAKATSHLLAAFGGGEIPGSRGASAYVFKIGELTLAIVIEGLGTKSMIAEEYLTLTGISRFADIAVDAVGTVVNDVISVGSVPAVVTAYFSTGDAAWYADERRSLELLAGWQRACEDAGAAWGGGESPALPGLVAANGIELGGSAVGVIPPGREAILGEGIEPGDRIVFLASSGLHANGASLARHVATELPEGLLTPLPSGRSLGDALLDPTVLYPRFVRALLETDIRPRFLNGVTGHGLMKVMRAPTQVRYVIETVPEVPEVLDFLVRQSEMSPQEAYGTLNMGIGYAAVVAADDADRTVEIARDGGYDAFVAGEVVSGDRSVVVPSLGVEFRDTDYRVG